MAAPPEPALAVMAAREEIHATTVAAAVLEVTLVTEAVFALAREPLVPVVAAALLATTTAAAALVFLDKARMALPVEVAPRAAAVPVAITVRHGFPEAVMGQAGLSVAEVLARTFVSVAAAVRSATSTTFL